MFRARAAYVGVAWHVLASDSEFECMWNVSTAGRATCTFPVDPTPHTCTAALGLQALTAPNPSFTSSPQPAFVALSVAVARQFMSGSLLTLRCCGGLEQTMKLNVIILFPKSSNYAEVTCHYASVYRSVKINTKNLTAGLIDIILNHNFYVVFYTFILFFSQQVAIQLHNSCMCWYNSFKPIYTY